MSDVPVKFVFISWMLNIQCGTILIEVRYFILPVNNLSVLIITAVRSINRQFQQMVTFLTENQDNPQLDSTSPKGKSFFQLQRVIEFIILSVADIMVFFFKGHD